MKKAVKVVLGIIVIMAMAVVGFYMSIPYWKVFPVWVDDHSGLDNDVFSRIIVEGRYTIEDVADSASSVKVRFVNAMGLQRLNMRRVESLSDSIFIGQHKDVVMKTFNMFGCGCIVDEKKSGEQVLKCKVRRQWKLKNIGKKQTTIGTIAPGIVLMYEFTVGENDTVKEVILDYMDVTRIPKHVKDSTIIYGHAKDSITIK